MTKISIDPSLTFSAFKKQDLEQSIFKRFEQQVAKFPDKLAVKEPDYQLTYEQLNRAANRLAHSILAEQGEGQELIPILFEHGTTMIVAMLGVLKAGKGWVPIDPWYPPNRIHHILESSQASLLISNNQNLRLAQEVAAKRGAIINLDELDNSLSDDNLNLSISPDTIACVLPTSGSTGEPKGVVHNHRNFLHASMRWTNSFCICPQDRVLMLNSYCHIGGINNILSTLLNGAVSYPYNIKERGLTDLADWMMAKGITIYHSVSTVFRHFIDTFNGKEEFPKLRLIHLGGESVSKHDFQLSQKYFSSDCFFLNSFGCTEISSYRQYFLNMSSQITTNVIPVGYGAEDTDILLLDENGTEVEVDCVGEIVVKSPYLALGYWQRQDLTAKAFTSDASGVNERLYRTGDLGKLMPDGCLIHLGRKDSQVQIRGYRVEVGESEAVLTEHVAIKEAAVLDWDNEHGEKSLVAYIVPYQGQTVSSNDLSSFLQQRLPSYLIPASYVFLDALPLNSNGKVDRRALPVPNQSNQETSKSNTFVVPRDKLESLLTQIWSQVLNIKQIGVQDNFFELGGNSLQAVNLFAQIEQQFGKKLPLATLFQSGTVAQIAEIIRQEKWLAPWASLVPIQPQGNKPPLFYIHGGGGNLLVYRDLAFALGEDQPVYGLQPRGLDGRYAPFNRIEDMAAYYLAQIRKLQPHGPYFLAGLSSGGTTAWEIAQILQTQGEQVALLALFDTNRPNCRKLLSPLPRLLSVFQSVMSNLLSRAILLPPKIVSQLKQLGTKQTSLKALENLKIVKQVLNEDQKINQEKMQRNFDLRLAKYQSVSGKVSVGERWINSLSIWLLEHFARGYYTNVFVEGLAGNYIDTIDEISEIPEELQQVQKANIEANQNYTPSVYSGRVTLFRASERPPGFYFDPQLGWGELAAEGIEVYEIVGNHTSIMKSAVLAEKLKICLDKAQVNDVAELMNIK